MVKKIKDLPTTCRKVDALIKDEAMAHKEYLNFASKSKDTVHNDFKEMAEDEAKHKRYLESMKNWYCEK
jgi:rubrerythrin